MLKINNIEKILAINSQSVEILSADQRPDYYEFAFMYDNIHSTVFSAHMNRKPDSGDNDTFTLKLYDGIISTPLEYQFARRDVKDPFTLLKYLADVIYDWDIITNK
jgi:hypothetical protein